MRPKEQVASLAQELLENLGHGRAVGFTVVFGDVEAAIEASDLLPDNEVNSCPRNFASYVQAPNEESGLLPCNKHLSTFIYKSATQ